MASSGSAITDFADNFITQDQIKNPGKLAERIINWWYVIIGFAVLFGWPIVFGIFAFETQKTCDQPDLLGTEKTFFWLYLWTTVAWLAVLIPGKLIFDPAAEGGYKNWKNITIIILVIVLVLWVLFVWAYTLAEGWINWKNSARVDGCYGLWWSLLAFDITQSVIVGLFFCALLFVTTIICIGFFSAEEKKAEAAATAPAETNPLLNNGAPNTQVVNEVATGGV